MESMMNLSDWKRSVLRDVAQVGGWSVSTISWTQSDWYAVRRVLMQLGDGSSRYAERLAELSVTSIGVETFRLRASFLEVRRLLEEVRENPFRVEEVCPSVVLIFLVMQQGVVRRAKATSSIGLHEWRELLLLQVEIVLTIERLWRIERSSLLHGLLRHPMQLVRPLLRDLERFVRPGKEDDDMTPRGFWRYCKEKLEPEEVQLAHESAKRTSLDWSQRLSKAYSEVLGLLTEEIAELSSVSIESRNDAEL